MSILMTAVRWLGLLLLSLLATVSAPFLVLLVLPFCREDYNNVLPPCGIFRAGWKLESLTHAPGPVMFLLQLKPWLTIDSTT